MTPRNSRIFPHCLILLFLFPYMLSAQEKTNELKDRVVASMKKASRYYREHVARHGGYVYFTTLDFSRRWGEGPASEDQIWVQPPGTPTVGLAYLDAYSATSDPFYLEAAVEAADALVYGQMNSGGWTNCIDFNPKGNRVADYRNGKGKGRNTSSLDDGQTQTALLFLIRCDAALKFSDPKIHQACEVALNALLNAQYPNGAFPQVWDDDVMPDPPARKAGYPEYDWRTEGKIKEYWNLYTLNDNVTGYVSETLIAAHKVYKEKKYLQALVRLGEFLIDAQMPAPQSGWAQQYNYRMQPVWARRFEPPAVSGDETQEVISTLIRIAEYSEDKRFLAPIPRALDFLERSKLKDGRLARYYELRTNRPLYMNRNGKNYFLTYDDKNLPSHYGWKTNSRIEKLRKQYSNAQTGRASSIDQVKSSAASRIIAELDEQGRWVDTYQSGRLVGQPKFQKGERYLSSERFSDNINQLARFLRQE